MRLFGKKIIPGVRVEVEAEQTTEDLLASKVKKDSLDIVRY